MAFYECSEDFELESIDHDRLYCSKEKWVGDTPRCQPAKEEDGDEEGALELN